MAGTTSATGGQTARQSGAGTTAGSRQPGRRGTKTTVSDNANVNATQDVPIDPTLTLPGGPNDPPPVVRPQVDPGPPPAVAMDALLAAQMKEMEGEFRVR